MLSTDTKAKALIMYHNVRTHRLDLTSHDVIETDSEGEFTLGAGRAFSLEDKETLVDILMNSETEVEFLNPRILVKSRSLLVWYTPPQVIDVQFKAVSHTAPIPGLVYIVRADGSLRCFAYKGKRPNEHSKLYRAPLGNVYSDGSFCTGNAAKPKDNSVASIEGWENFVLRCTNTHLGQVAVLKNVEHTEEALIDFYKTLSESGAKSFPASRLAPVIVSYGEHLELKPALSMETIQ